MSSALCLMMLEHYIWPGELGAKKIRGMPFILIFQSKQGKSFRGGKAQIRFPPLHPLLSQRISAPGNKPVQFVVESAGQEIYIWLFSPLTQVPEHSCV